jgi:hypothetical protein
MPYVKNLLDNLDNHISDLGWEKNSIEYDIDMIPDEEECPMAKQESREVKFVYRIPEESWNSDLLGYHKMKKGN